MHSTQFSDSLPLIQVRPYFVCRYGLCIHSSPRTNSVLCTKTDLKQPVASAVPMSRCPLLFPCTPPPALSLPGIGDKMGKVAGPEQSDKCMYRQKKRRKEIKRRRWLLAGSLWLATSPRGFNRYRYPSSLVVRLVDISEAEKKKIINYRAAA